MKIYKLIIKDLIKNQARTLNDLISFKRIVSKNTKFPFQAIFSY